ESLVWHTRPLDAFHSAGHRPGQPRRPDYLLCRGVGNPGDLKHVGGLQSELPVLVRLPANPRLHRAGINEAVTAQDAPPGLGYLVVEVDLKALTHLVLHDLHARCDYCSVFTMRDLVG